MLKVYAYPRSRSSRVLWLLEELGIDYTIEKVDLMQGAGQAEGYKKIHADGKVPAIDDDGFVLTESAAIMTYLADKYPKKKLIPAVGTQQRARFNEWSYFILTELEQPLWTIGKHTFVFPEEKRVKEVLDVALWEFEKACKAAVTMLGNQPFALGAEFSAIDVLLAQTLKWAQAFKVPTHQASLDDYRDRLLQREAFLRVVEKEKPLL